MKTLLHRNTVAVKERTNLDSGKFTYIVAWDLVPHLNA